MIFDFLKEQTFNPSYVFLTKNNSPFQCLGVYYAEGTPVPFPNTEVKLCRADGSSPQWVQE